MLIYIWQFFGQLHGKHEEWIFLKFNYFFVRYDLKKESRKNKVEKESKELKWDDKVKI